MNGQFGGSGDDYSVNAEINMVPLIDIMLVLMVVFILSASAALTQTPVDLPDRASGASASQGVQIGVLASGLITLNDKPISEANLNQALAELPTDQPVLILADKQAVFERVAEVMGAAQSAGFSEVSFVFDS